MAAAARRLAGIAAVVPAVAAIAARASVGRLKAHGVVRSRVRRFIWLAVIAILRAARAVARHIKIHGVIAYGRGCFVRFIAIAVLRAIAARILRHVEIHRIIAGRNGRFICLAAIAVLRAIAACILRHIKIHRIVTDRRGAFVGALAVTAALFGRIERHGVKFPSRRPAHGLVLLLPGAGVIFFCQAPLKTLAQPAFFRMLGGLFLLGHVFSFTPQIRPVLFACSSNPCRPGSRLPLPAHPASDKSKAGIPRQISRRPSLPARTRHLPKPSKKPKRASPFCMIRPAIILIVIAIIMLSPNSAFFNPGRQIYIFFIYVSPL